MKRSYLRRLKVKEKIYYSGRLYLARDQAHKRLVEAIKKKRKLPIELNDRIIYYCGPTDAGPGAIIGSCGPTTASRMDSFTPPLLRKGLAATIGKGRRSQEVRRAIKKYGAVYFVTTGGAGAYLSQKVKSSRVVAYKDLGPEAIREVEVEGFPLYVAIDSKGKSIY